MLDDATIRLAIGLILLGAALAAVGIGILMTETAAQAEHT